MLHLKGMYLAKQHEASLYEEVDQESILAKNEAESLARRIRREYFEHIKHHGYDKCSYIPRHHGDQLSLLTEIVEKNKKQALFSIQKKNKESQQMWSINQTQTISLQVSKKGLHNYNILV